MDPHSFHRHPELVSGSISPPTRSKRRQAQPHSKVAPLRVFAIDQIDFPRPVPTLELLFSRDCGDHIAEHFKVDQPVDGIAFGETGQRAFAMLPHSPQQIGRHANIQRPVAAARKNINARNPFLPHGPECAAKWTLKQVQGDGFGMGLVISSARTPIRHAELVSTSIVPLVPKL